MTFYICAVFIKDDLLFSTKSKTNNDLWSLPIGDKPYNLIYDTSIDSLKDEIKSEFEVEGCMFRDKYEGEVIINGELCNSKTKDIELSIKRESKWISLEEIDKLEWEDWVKPIIEEVKEKLKKQRYIITLDNINGSNACRDKNYNEVKETVEIVFDKECSYIEVYRAFSKAIKSQQLEYRKGNIKWRVVRMYDEKGKQIAQES